jgi:hypothetical protein
MPAVIGASVTNRYDSLEGSEHAQIILIALGIKMPTLPSPGGEK